MNNKPKMYIVSNQIECLLCGDKPFSMSRHHYSPCICGKVAVDGGQDYCKRIGDPSHYKELAIVMEEDLFMRFVGDITSSMDSGRNTIGIAYAALRSLRDIGYRGNK